MSIVDVNAFLSVIDNGNFSRAAESLYISQSVLTKRIQALEEECQRQLLERERGRRVVKLTTAGLEFLPIARRFAAVYQDTKDFAAGKTINMLNLGGSDGVMHFALLDFLQSLTSSPIPFQVQIGVFQSSDLYNRLSNYTLDIAFTRQMIDSKDIIGQPLFSEKMYLVCSSLKKFAPGPIHPSELNPQSELYSEYDAEFQRWHRSWFGSDDNVRIHIQSVSLIWNLLIKSPDLWAIVPESTARVMVYPGLLEVHEIEEGPSALTCYLLRHRSPRPNIEASIAYLKEHLLKFVDDKSPLALETDNRQP